MKTIIFFGFDLFIVILIGFLSYFLFIFRFGLLHYDVKIFIIPPQTKYNNWKEIFKKGKEMEFIAFKSGYAVAQSNARPYLNLESLPTNFDINKQEVSPIYSYYVKHPQQGDMLFDAGLDYSFYNKPPVGSLHLMLKMYQNKTKTFYKEDYNQNMGYWLDKYKINPDIVFMTHLHPDHICGLLELNDSIKIIFGKKENSFYYKAICGKYFGKKKLFAIDFNNSISIYPFSKTIDVFGDGSIWAISSPGHTIDHISYLINIKNNPVLIIGDLSISKDYLMDNIEISCDNGKKGIQQLHSSLKELKEFKNKYPNVKIFFSHSD